jgi:hypothetical protein
VIPKITSTSAGCGWSVRSALDAFIGWLDSCRRALPLHHPIGVK